MVSECSERVDDDVAHPQARHIAGSTHITHAHLFLSFHVLFLVLIPSSLCDDAKRSHTIFPFSDHTLLVELPHMLDGVLHLFAVDWR